MPELPEVETIVRGLDGPLSRRRVIGARLRPASLYRAGSLPVGRLADRTVTRVCRVGKNAVFFFEPSGVMVVNLGMTGRLLFYPAGGPRPPRCEKHVHGRFFFDDGSELRYCDPRRFGFVYVASSRDVAGSSGVAVAGNVAGSCDVARALGLGPDPFQADARYLARTLDGRRAPVKPLLLDQRIVSGLGNIYADETLFLARMDPRTPGDRAGGRAGKILWSARRILERAIAGGGSTIRDYRRPDGSRGGFQRFHAVYGRCGEPCVRCGTPVRKIVLSGRGTHFCPSCQR